MNIDLMNDNNDHNISTIDTTPTQADHEEQYHFDTLKQAFEVDRKLRNKQYGSVTDFGRAIISKALICFTEDGEAKT